jgi:hypothetical protein
MAKGTATLTCTAGTLLVGGGGDALGNGTLVSSYPTENGWTATASTPNTNVRVYALCAS